MVVDHTLTERRWLAECVALWRELPVLFVGVRCPWEVVEQRLRGVGDRPEAATELFVGAAPWQYERVHAHGGGYDLEIDTSQAGPEACAEVIERARREGPPSTAFRHLAAEPDALALRLDGAAAGLRRGSGGHPPIATPAGRGCGRWSG